MLFTMLFVFMSWIAPCDLPWCGKEPHCGRTPVCVPTAPDVWFTTTDVNHD